MDKQKELTFTEWMAKIKNVHFADREAMDRAIASLTKPYREDADIHRPRR